MIPIRLGLQQRVLPHYRVPFFQALAANCPQGLGLFAGEPRANEMIENRLVVPGAQLTTAVNHHILHGKLYHCWQSGWMRWLNHFKPQVLILEANPRYLRTPAAVRWMHQRGLPVIGWGLGAPKVRGILALLLNQQRRHFIHQFDALITYSQQGKEQYQALGYPVEKIFIACNAAAARPTAPPAQRGLDVEPNHLVVLYVGRLQARKRVDNLIRACAALPADQQPQLWIVGNGPERGDLETLAQRVYPATQFWGTQIGSELDELFDQADLFVLPGTGGLAMQQAMAHALPVIVAEGDGTQSDLLRPENGWEIAHNSPQALAGSIQQALSDLPRLRQMGLASYRIVAEEVNLETMVAAFEQAVLSVLPESVNPQT